MEKKARFTMIDEQFRCDNCGKLVKPLGYTARDHCPYCLYSKHLDNNPGDRSSSCYGLLKPIAIEPSKKDDFKIVYVCKKCGCIKKNKKAIDDNLDLIIEIMNEAQDIKKYKRTKK